MIAAVKLVLFFYALQCEGLQPMSQGPTVAPDSNPSVTPILKTVCRSDELCRKEEDDLALAIYNKHIAAPASKCQGLREMLEAYARDTMMWDLGDLVNPEFSLEKTTKANIEIILEKNEAIKNFRESLTDELAPKNPSCGLLWHMLSCQIMTIRDLAPYEFALKEPFPQDDNWIAMVKSGGAPTLKWGLQDHDVVKYYSKVRCLVTTNEKECHKGTPQAGLVKMFSHKKGRGVPGGAYKAPVVPKTRSWGGIPLLDNAGKPINLNPKLNNFFDVWKNIHSKAFIDPKSTRTAFNPVTKTKTTDFATDSDQINPTHWAATHFDEATMGAACAKQFPGDTDACVKNTEACNEAAEVVHEFKLCNVPWVGGVSGSVLEMFAFLDYKKPGSIDDLLILQWMSLYELRGFHSLGEVWSALRPYLEAQPAVFNKLEMRNVPAPLRMDGCHKIDGKEALGDSEGIFLEALRTVLDNHR